jgi:hypothetical protein
MKEEGSSPTLQSAELRVRIDDSRLLMCAIDYEAIRGLYAFGMFSYDR